MVYSEAGGVTKTTAAVSLAAVCASQGMRTILVDLDPRAASTKWLDVEPAGEGLHVGAILAEAEPTGWVADLAVQSEWFDTLSVVPSGRSVSNREADRADFAELRLSTAFEGVAADVVVIDCPNRQGGPLTLNALHAADRVVYAAQANGDGVDGVVGARHTVEHFQRNRAKLGAPASLDEAGIVCTREGTGFMSRPEVEAVDQLRETGLLLMPIVPLLAIVPEVRFAGQWYGRYRKGQAVLEAYTQIAKEVFA